MTNREKIFSTSFIDVIKAYTKYNAEEIENLMIRCEFFNCTMCLFKDDKNCQVKMTKWLNEDVPNDTIPN